MDELVEMRLITHNDIADIYSQTKKKFVMNVNNVNKSDSIFI